jgi:hypothetical protein
MLLVQLQLPPSSCKVYAARLTLLELRHAGPPVEKHFDEPGLYR